MIVQIFLTVKRDVEALIGEHAKFIECVQSLVILVLDLPRDAVFLIQVDIGVFLIKNGEGGEKREDVPNGMEAIFLHEPFFQSRVSHAVAIGANLFRKVAIRDKNILITVEVGYLILDRQFVELLRDGGLLVGGVIVTFKHRIVVRPRREQQHQPESARRVRPIHLTKLKIVRRDLKLVQQP